MPQLDSNFLSLIHKLYRLIFYRDAIDPQPIDEAIPTALTTLINDLIASLLRKVCVSDQFLPALLDGLQTKETAHTSLCVLNELFEYCKGTSVVDREALVR